MGLRETIKTLLLLKVIVVQSRQVDEAFSRRKLLTPVTIEGRRGSEPKVFDTDEEMFKTQPKKIPTLRSAFKKDGTITAANASTLNDGAAAMVLMTGDKARELVFNPLSRIRGFADAAQDPVEFTIAPSKAVLLALNHEGLQLSGVYYHEMSEAFSVVVPANMRLMNIPHDRVNVHGGAVAIGHRHRYIWKNIQS
ncbi:hypothetical protein PsorP6_015918 [Peronosclerospora sorghi]|uniref:Uncharacterized protein n=1 Tax=Peronosclerospora sorghi TaxID=230839 RepID=A0ACC0WRC5_9STRA|nr:hypothetical protein PsorP6_015918 [Peronosclerospora sorghi]